MLITLTEQHIQSINMSISTSMIRQTVNEYSFQGLLVLIRLKVGQLERNVFRSKGGQWKEMYLSQ